MESHHITKIPCDESFICLFSGGKDSFLALAIAMQDGKADSLITSFENMDEFNIFHQNVEFTKIQANSLDIPLSICIGDSKTTHMMYKVAKKLKSFGLKYFITGNIYNEKDLELNNKLADVSNMILCCPLWGMEPEEVLEQLISRNIKSIITSIQHSSISQSWLGKLYTEETFYEFKNLGIDPLGENGEFSHYGS